MKAWELKENVLKGKCYYIEGDDAYWGDHALRFFISLVPEENRIFNLKILNGIRSVDEITDAAETSPFFPGEQVVLIKDQGYKIKEDEKSVLNALIKNTEAFLIFYKCAFLTPQNKKEMTSVEASRADFTVINAYIDGAYGKNSIDGSARHLLMEYTGGDTARIQTEMQKLIAYTGGKTVREADVKELVENTVENQIYEFTGALAERNKTLAMNILVRFEESGAAPAYLLAALSSQYRRMLHAALSKKSDAETAAFLGVKEYAVKKARESAAKYTVVKLKNCLDALTDAEYSFKSGAMSEETAFGRAMAKLLST